MCGAGLLLQPNQRTIGQILAISPRHATVDHCGVDVRASDKNGSQLAAVLIRPSIGHSDHAAEGHGGQRLPCACPISLPAFRRIDLSQADADRTGCDKNVQRIAIHDANDGAGKIRECGRANGQQDSDKCGQ